MISIDDDVEFITEQIDRLRQLGEHEGRSNVFNDEDVYDLSIRWGAALSGRLPRIVHYSSAGLLADADERRFQSLCDELRAVSPLIERFELPPPHLTDFPCAQGGGRRRGKKRPAKRGRLRRR